MFHLVYVPHHYEEVEDAGMYDEVCVGGSLCVAPEVDANARPVLFSRFVSV